MPSTVSILTPTHNRSDILARVIESLREADKPPNTSIELIVVANACTDNTVEMVNAVALHMPFTIRCVEEQTVGVCHARNRAVRESTGNILVFIDDDLCVARTWLTGILDVMETQSADLVSGKTVLWWEAVARPRWMDRRAEHLLSCVDYGNTVIELNEPGLAISANFAVKREVFDRLGLFANLGRTPKAPLSGEDTEFFARALDAGYRMFYAPLAEAKHWVAPHRITLKYLSAVAYSNGLVRPYLRKTLSRGQAMRIIAKYTFRWLAYCVLEGIAALFFMKKARVNNRIRRMTCRGNVIGTYHRMHGLSPTGEPIDALRAEPLTPPPAPQLTPERR
jgi:glycosyltransferase involved in cell wall biosynthesis